MAIALLGVGMSNVSAQEASTQNLPLDKVVVTGTKFELPVEKSGKTIYKITAKDIEQNAGKSVANFLNEVPGMHVDGSLNHPGTNQTYYLRGGRDKHTLILIDGVPLNDPSGISATYDLRFLSMSQVESIEILKGGLSTLHGTGAASGVISIKLKEATQDTVNAEVGVKTGSFGTLGGNVGVSGTADKFSYQLSGNLLSVDGMSVASDEKSNTKFDKDTWKQQNGLLKLGYKFSDKFNLGLVTGYDDFKADYDNGAHADGDNRQLSNQFRIGLTPTFTYTKGSVQLKALANYNDKEFESQYPSHSKGKNIQTDLVHQHQINDYLKVLWGLNIQDLSFKNVGTDDFNDNHFTLFDQYASLFFENNNGLNIHGGIRLNTHSTYDSKLVYNLNPSYLIALSDEVSLKLLANVSTSYITPSLYQLYSAFGNKDLTPEESTNYEGGAALYLGSKVVVNLNYFHRDETNPIGWDPTRGESGGYANLTNIRTVKGFELDAKWNITDRWTAGGYYTHTSTNRETEFYRIPKEKAGISLGFDATSTTHLAANANFTSKRTVQDFSTWPATIVELDNYTMVDFYVQQKILNDNLTIYGAANNLLNADYVGVLGYTVRERNFTLGLTYKL